MTKRYIFQLIIEEEEDSPMRETVTPTVLENLTLTNANTEYSYTLPANVVDLVFKCRTANDIRFAFVPGKVATPTTPYATLKSGENYTNQPETTFKAGQVLYFAAGTTNLVVEIMGCLITP